MATSTVTESVHIIRIMLKAGAMAGVDPAIACKTINLDHSILDNPDARVAMEKEAALWHYLAACSGDDCFGLHAALTMEAGEFDVMDYAIRTSSTLRQALLNAQRYNRLLHDVAEFELDVDGKTARFSHFFRNDPKGANWHAADFTLASTYAIGVSITGKNWVPQRVCFQHAQPDDLTEYKKIFQCPLEFDHDRNQLLFNSDILDYAIISADPSLHLVLIRHANELLARLPQSDDLIEQVRSHVAIALRQGDPAIDQIAGALHITSRTLQRRLKDSGSSYKDVVDGMRKGLAGRYLNESKLGVSEIAYLLGYSEPSAFHRAFKRWFGESPAHFRQTRSTILKKSS